jgi:hypothetical protein
MQVVVQEAHIKVQVLVELEQETAHQVEEVQAAIKDTANMVLQQVQLILEAEAEAPEPVVQELL